MGKVVEEMREAAAFIRHWEKQHEVTLPGLELIAFRAQAYSLAADGCRVFDEAIRVQGGKPVIEELREELGGRAMAVICEGVQPGLRGKGPWHVGAACFDEISPDVQESTVVAGLDRFLCEQPSGATVDCRALESRAAELIRQDGEERRGDAAPGWDERRFYGNPLSRGRLARGLAAIQAGRMVKRDGTPVRPEDLQANG